MAFNNKYDDNEIFQTVFSEVLRIVNALKSEDISDQMEANKEIIYDRVNRKIDTNTSTDTNISARTAKQKKIFIHRYTAIASVVILLILSTFLIAYRTGYHSGKELLSQDLIEIKVPYGIISTIKLSDGSIATLNGGSTLIYPSIFNKKREVALSGEGYFEIIKNEKLPFIVNAGHLSVEVLGTRFNLKAYEEDLQSTVTLQEGSVKVIPANDEWKKEGIMLLPDQHLILDNKTGEFRCHNITAKDYISWKDGTLSFRDITLEEIAMILERRFDVSISIPSEEIRNECYVAKFKNGENLNKILELLSEKNTWKYIEQNDTIKIINR